MKKKYSIEVDCANCAAKAEAAACKVAGVKSANVSFMTQKIIIEFDDGADVDAVMKDVKKAVKKVDDDIEIKGV